MPLTADQYQQLIVLEVGDVGDLIVSQIDTLWTLYDTQTDAYTQYLYAKRKALEILMGSVREQVNRRGINGIAADLSDKFKHLQAMYQTVDAEIASIGSGQAAVAQLASPYTDPTSPSYPTAADRWRVDIANWRP
jgi:hypothetical protein